MPHITVRQAVFSDLDVLADLFNQYRAFQGCASQPVAAREFLRGHFDHGEAIVFLAHEAGQALYQAAGWRQDAQFHMYHRFPESS